MPFRHVLGMRVDAPRTYAEEVDRIPGCSGAAVSRTIAVATVSTVRGSYDDAASRDVMNACDRLTPDGMPLVWGLSILGVRSATHVCGPELTPLLLARAAE